jgi:nitrous-oxide reductase
MSTDTGEDRRKDPEEVIEEYEQSLQDVLAEVDEPVPDDDGPLLELAGLELDRRDFMKTGVAAGAIGALAGCSGGSGSASPAQQTASSGSGGVDHSVAPGEHDEYYGFWSGGHSGELRVVGIPSMRELTRIPVFNTDCASGYGYDDQTSQMLEESGGYTWGDNHHPNLSETGGDYDGEYLFVNDKANGRVARVNLTYFETDAILDVPNMQAVHGCSVLSPDTEYILCNGEFRTPLPNDGRDVNNPEEYTALFAAVDPESMETAWQVRVDGNLDIVDSGKEGRWAIASGYNSEEATSIQGMTRDDRDMVKAFDIPAIEQAVENGDHERTVNGVPIVDGTQSSPLNQGDRPIVRYVPTPKSPHCVEVGPNGEYAFIAGKLSPTVTMLALDQLDQVSDPAEAVVGRPRVGLGPLHTTFDGNGHAYTSLFIDSQVAKWDIQAAVDAEANSTEPIIEKLDVHYNPGHIQALEAMTTDPDGEWLVCLNKLSKDRFLPVGPIMPDNDQLIHIGQGEKSMELVADHPAYPEPHDCVFAHKDKISPRKVYDRADYEGEKPYITEADSGVEQGDGSVHVKVSTKRSEYGLPEFTVQQGDEVRLTVTNIEGIQDIIHGVAIPEYDVNLAVAPQDTREVTFTADKPGVYWIYCTYFCSALHLEMRSRMIVEPSE